MPGAAERGESREAAASSGLTSAHAALRLSPGNESHCRVACRAPATVSGDREGPCSLEQLP